ncbi:hypothetical protein [Acaryochloris marina]|uniref:Uncharacterized protein n=1 Tax=Acaryochloris marina (strain MBIC 11017) TaxID=329726 RepID=B0C268_ACAM1|nr:hypothetical protein [Acaryochloris marina]ABW28520.1 hypothetical protein AM1_3530 [Acaryochloris marina MBIC11017]BDM77519.1 hypothetical protein AM10699_03930 [Acaryochloris marina MBIC10699]
MSQIHTNRDLCPEINNLLQQQIQNQRTLEIYLRALLAGVNCYADAVSIRANEFYELLERGFVGVPLPFSTEWNEQYDDLPNNFASFHSVQLTLIRQIVDLHEMADHGMLANKLRYFGIHSPRKSIWYNFEPVSYLECAVAGSLDVEDSRNDTLQQFVPGLIEALDDSAQQGTKNSDDMPSPQNDLERVTWQQFQVFLDCGQMYE